MINEYFKWLVFTKKLLFTILKISIMLFLERRLQSG